MPDKRDDLDDNTEGSAANESGYTMSEITEMIARVSLEATEAVLAVASYIRYSESQYDDAKSIYHAAAEAKRKWDRSLK